MQWPSMAWRVENTVFSSRPNGRHRRRSWSTNRAVLIEQVEAIRRRYGRVMFDDPGTAILWATVYDASVLVWLSAAGFRFGRGIGSARG